jgi:hypothetical protein
MLLARVLLTILDITTTIRIIFGHRRPSDDYMPHIGR